MNIIFHKGLLITSLAITFKGKTKLIENVVIDTGASCSIISPDIVEDIGIAFKEGDTIATAYGIGGKQYAFVKKVDRIKFNTFSITHINIDFGLIDKTGHINGLLGLDILMKVGAVIDLKNLMFYKGIWIVCAGRF